MGPRMGRPAGRERPGREDFNAEIRTCMENGNGAGAIDAVRRMINSGIRPDTLAYGVLMKAMAAFGDCRTGQMIVNKMRDCGLRPDRFILNDLVAAHLAAGDCKGACRVARGMTAEGAVPDVAYDLIIRACVELGDLSTAMQCFREMLEARVIPGNDTCTAVLKICESRGDLEMAGVIWDAMADHGVQPSANAYAFMAATFEGAGYPELADNLLGRAVEDGTLHPTLGYRVAENGRPVIDLHPEYVLGPNPPRSVSGTSAKLASVVMSHHLRRGRMQPYTPVVTGQGEGVLRDVAAKALLRAELPFRDALGNPGCLVVLPPGGEDPELQQAAG